MVDSVWSTRRREPSQVCENVVCTKVSFKSQHNKSCNKYFSIKIFVLVLSCIYISLIRGVDGFTTHRIEWRRHPGCLQPSEKVHFAPFQTSQVQQCNVLKSAALPPNEDGSATRLQKRQIMRHAVPISTAIVIGSFSVLEILESFREVAARQLGHAHGIAVLAFIRLCRSISILQTEAEEFVEEIHELEEYVGIKPPKTSFTTKLGKFLISPIVTVTACVVAAVTSCIEIYDDSKPGAHHGAALLALSELWYQLRRLRHFLYLKGVLNKPQGGAAKTLRHFRFGVFIALAAAGYAGYEVFEDMKPGAHHGVVILAFAELVENINRSKFWN